MADVFYPYRDESSQLLYQVVRREPKGFEIRDAGGKPLGEFPERTVLYRLPELLAADRRELAYVTEGEKDADRFAELRLLATTNPGGCRLGWKKEYTSDLSRRHVIVLADNDRPGARHAEQVEMSLRGNAESIAVLKLPRLRRAEDVSEWLDYRRGTRDELVNLANKLVRLAHPTPRSASAGGHQKRHRIFMSRTLDSSQRLLLLAIQHYSGDLRKLTAGDLADCTGLHRVTVQRLIAKLCQRSMLCRRGERLEVCWDHVI